MGAILAFLHSMPGHPYTAGLPLMGNILFPTIACSVYVLSCPHSDFFIRFISPFIYRIFNTFRIWAHLSLGILLTVLRTLDHQPIFCAPVPHPGNPTLQGVNIALTLYAIFIVRLCDLLDVVFLAHARNWRAGQRSISSYTQFHHVCVVFLYWFPVKLIPGGSTTIPVIVTSFSNFLFYCFLRWNTAQPRHARVRYSQAVNVKLIIQYSVIIVHSGIQLFTKGCAFPMFPSIFLICFTISFEAYTLLSTSDACL